jgi:predicted lipoprotein with Yx(FWY)xxD motif
MIRSMTHLRACAFAAVALALLGTAACGDDSGDDGGPYGGTPTSAEESPTDGGTAETAAALAVESNADYGDILVDGEGMVLYLFTNDTTSESTCYDQCATAWPPLLTDTEDVTADAGVDAQLLGTTERNDGTMQVTYNDHPLYYFAQDAAPGDTNGQGVQDIWWVVNPAGEGVTTMKLGLRAVRAAPAVAALRAAPPRVLQGDLGAAGVGQLLQVAAGAHTGHADPLGAFGR